MRLLHLFKGPIGPQGLKGDVGQKGEQGDVRMTLF